VNTDQNVTNDGLQRSAYLHVDRINVRQSLAQIPHVCDAGN